MRDGTPVRGWAPASLSNLGPGFDALGLALHGVGDVVEACWCSAPGVRVVSTGDDSIPADAFGNTAARAAMHVLRRHDDAGVELRIRKGIRPGSGLGSSAASAVAAAWAVARLMDRAVSKDTLVESVLEGEAAVSGARHGDNVLPSLFGGLVLVSPSDPTKFRVVEVPVQAYVAVVRPDVKILTREARAMLPERVALRDAVHNASSLAFMIDAWRAGDLEEVGRMLETDRLVEPVRAALVPDYEAIRTAAREAGACGCALSGSGPAMFALSADALTADRIRTAMEVVIHASGQTCTSFVSRVDREGARDADADEPDRVV